MKFIHTSDWQLGMTRRFLKDGAQELYDQARFEAIRTIARLVSAERCDFVAVAGDVFESNRVGKKTFLRAMEALKGIPAPVFLLPGNHDPLSEGSIYQSRRFVEHLPANVTLLDDFVPRAASAGIEVVGAPWRSKQPVRNPVADLIETLPPADGVLRVCIAHGGLLGPFNPGDERAIDAEMLEQAIRDGKFQYAALGDRHSSEQIGGSGRIWYSGTPEVTAFDEPNPGFVNVVDMDHERIKVSREKVGAWSFAEIEAGDLFSGEDAGVLFTRLSACPAKSSTAVRLRLSGMLGVRDMDLVHRRLDDFGDIFASFEVDDGLGLAVPETLDAAEGLSGFGAEAARELRDLAAANGADARLARDALLLLLRLAGEGTK